MPRWRTRSDDADSPDRANAGRRGLARCADYAQGLYVRWAALRIISETAPKRAGGRADQVPERGRHAREVEDQQIASVFDWRGKDRDVNVARGPGRKGPHGLIRLGRPLGRQPPQ